MCSLLLYLKHMNQRDNSKFYIYSFYIACSCEGSQAHFA